MPTIEDLVTYRGKGPFKVTAITHPNYGWCHAVPKKKDGSWSLAVRHLIGDVKKVEE